MSRAQPWKLELPQVSDQATQQAMERIREWCAPFGGDPQPDGLRLLALLLGGQKLTATLSTGADTEVPHELNRFPSMVMLAVARDGLGGFVYGEPSGGTSANTGAWNRQNVYLRASRAATFDLLLV